VSPFFSTQLENTMTAITASMVAELRAKTDAPMMECKKALTEAAGNMEKAEELLRVKLGSKAGKAASRITAEGVVAIDNFVPTTTTTNQTRTVRVQVSDGLLTLDAAGGTNTKIDYVHIAQVVPTTSTTVAPTTTTTRPSPGTTPTRFSFGTSVAAGALRLRPIVGASPLSPYPPSTWATQGCRAASCAGVRL
jgi:hypothetical protein